MDFIILLLISVSVLMRLPQGAKGCTNRSVQLFNKSGINFVQYCLDGEWRWLCRGEGVWSPTEHVVTCRQLGMGAPAMGDGACDALATTPSRKFFRLAKNCIGSESSIEECGGIVIVDQCAYCHKSYGILNCIKVKCNGESEIRLAGGATNREGRVEVCMDGRWRSVCTNSSQKGIAGAVCSHLGFPARGAQISETFLKSLGPLTSTCTVQEYMGTIKCTQVNDGSCEHTPELGVSCKTHIQIIINDTLDSCRNKPTPPTAFSTSSTRRDVIIVALEVVVGLLLVLQLVTLSGWIFSYCWKKSAHSKPSQLQEDVMLTQSDDSSLIMRQNTTNTTCNNGLYTRYDVIEQNRVQTKLANPTPVMSNEAGKERDSFYDADKHIYSVVNIKHKKKTNLKTADNGKGSISV